MQWSYYIEEIQFGQPIADILEQLNELGLEGQWEAVGALPVSGGSPNTVFVLFKKPVTAPRQSL